MSRNDNRNAAPASPGTEATKLCHIVKRPDFEGYGFNLHSEKVKPGQYIGKVDTNSPAEAAGLKEGDRIIEVNGVPIGSETHKQVVQRIKAIACEVRLLLVDADGSPLPPPPAAATPAATVNGNSNVDGSVQPQSTTVKEMPGASANISSISVVSTKRMSGASSNSKDSDVDETDRAITMPPPPMVHTPHHNGNSTKISELSSESKTPQAANHNNNNNNNNNNNSMMTPPPPSATMAAVPLTPPTASSNSRSALKTGGLQLPGTAAEMRAKLMSKKKYDPKNESVDLKKKFEIIQKL